MNRIDNKGRVRLKKWLYVVSFMSVVALVSMTKMKCSAETTVSSGDSATVCVTELDLGDCPKEILVGTSQMLSVLRIPSNATETEFVYESDNEEVATVNALGRLTANKLGKAQITVTCGAVKNSFEVSVVSALGAVSVQDIEVGDYEQELGVDKTMYLSAKVLPTNATNTSITYTSSDEQIATVNSSGTVKGIAPGEVTIEISAGNITKEIDLIVKLETTAIQLNSTYVVLKPKETFAIQASVSPGGADSNFSYKSLDTDVAEVSDIGVITAKNNGVTTIIVSNDDLQESLSVVVNEDGKVQEELMNGNGEGSDLEKTFPATILTKDYPVVTSEMLKYFYEKEKTLTIKGEGYTIFLDGKNIVNFENELYTKLVFEQSQEGLTFIVNKKQKLCGDVTIDIRDKVTSEKYLYLFNEATEKYERLEVEDITLLQIDTAGKYILTTEKISEVDVNEVVIVIGVVACVLGVVLYIMCKKRYWFW